MRDIMKLRSCFLILLGVLWLDPAYSQQASTSGSANDGGPAFSEPMTVAAARNQRRVILSPQATPDRYLTYVQAWARRIEAAGKQDFPQINAIRRHGSMLLTIAVGPEGQLLSVAVARSSGIAALDAAAFKVVAQAAPFAPFPEEMRSDTDVLIINREFTFLADSRLTLGKDISVSDASLSLGRNMKFEKPDTRGCVAPKYPADSAEVGESGIVQLVFRLSVDGTVMESMVQKSSGYSRLDAAAIDALSQCRFRPLMSDGQPREGWALLEFKWQLE